MPRLGRKRPGDVPIPPRMMAILFLAIWSTFAPIGTLMWMVTPQPGNWALGLAGATFSGLIAVAWAAAFIFERYWTIALIVPSSAALQYWNYRVLPGWSVASWGPFDGRHERLTVLALMSIVFLISGYVLVIWYTRGQERAATRARTELELAGSIHRTLVPPIDRRVGGLEVYGRSEPSSEMGGDLIDLVAQDGRVDLYLADVSGHGVRAGVVMGMVKSAIRMRLRTGASMDQMLLDLDAVLGQTIEPGMFVTFACLRFTAEGAVSFGLAGHPPVLHVPARGAPVRDLPNDHLPLGLETGEGYASRLMQCSAGDLFVLYTDGLLEVQDARGRQFGLDRLRALVQANAGRPLPDVHGAIMAGVRAHGAQSDDQTLLLARVL